MQKQKIILKNVSENFNLQDKKLYIIFLLFFIIPLTIYSYPQGWSADKFISHGEMPQIFNNNNIIGITFLVKKPNQTSVYIKLSNDKGDNWSPPEILVNKIGKRFEYITSTVNDNILYICWGEDDGFLYLLKYNLTNSLIISKQKLSDIKPFACLPKIVTDEEKNIHLFYHRELNEVFTLYHIVSFDKCRSWSKSHKIVEKISSQVCGIFFPDVKFWGDYIFIIWQNRQTQKKEKLINDDLYFTYSTDLGQTWEVPERLTDNKYNNSRPSLILNYKFQTIYIIWESDKQKDWDIFIGKGEILSKDNIEWEEEDSFQIISDTSTDSYFSKPILKDNNIYIFWYDFRKRKNQLFYRIFNPQTEQLSGEIQLTDTKTHSRKPEITLLSNAFYLVWEEKHKNYSGIYFKKQDTEIKKPVIYSPTHPTDKWTRKKNVIIRAHTIQDESGIKGYSYALDNESSTIPDIINYNTKEFNMGFQNVISGISYIHLRAIDNHDNWSETAHYEIKIDTLGPDITDVEIHPFQGRRNKYNIKFIIKYFDFSKVTGFSYKLSKKIQTKLPSKIMIKKNHGTVKNLEEGIWFFNIKGVDKLGNWSKIKHFKVILAVDDIPPAPPKIISLTHAINSVSAFQNPRFNFLSVDNVGIKGYNYIITKNPNYEPEKSFKTSRTNIKFKNVKDGEWFFIVRSVDYNNNWSKSSIFPFSIDSTGPQIENILCSVKTNIKRINNKTIYTTFSAVFKWNLTKEEKNIRYNFNIIKKKKQRLSLKTLSMSNKIKYDNLNKTNFYFKVKARDNLGNWGRAKTYYLNLIEKAKPVRQIIKAELFVYDDILHYRIKRGDNLYKIISFILLTEKPKFYINSIIKYNKIENPDIVIAGSILKFPLLRIKDTIVINKIKPTFLKMIKNRIIKVKRTEEGINLKKEKNLLNLWKNQLILIKLRLFLETGKFYFY